MSLPKLINCHTDTVKKVILEHFLNGILTQDINQSKKIVLTPVLAPDLMMGQIFSDLRIHGLYLFKRHPMDRFVLLTTNSNQEAVLNDIMRTQKLTVRNDLIVNSLLIIEVTFIFVREKFQK
jgi:folate-binding Fe-S cluster repair protein YgfZ